MNTQPIQPFSGVIFDLDGTLVESSLDFVWLREQLNCPEKMDLLTHVASLEPSAQASANQLIEQHELDDAHTARWLPGAQELVKAIAALGLPMAIVTRNSPQAAQTKIHNNQVGIHPVLTRNDAPPKPDPTALLSIAQQWQQSPQNIMYVGDYKYDLQAANNAGMHGCLYAPDGIPDYAHLAQSVCSDYTQLIAYLQRCLQTHT